VLGDLHERYRSPGQYGREALRTVPLVIASRIRRTADAQVLVMLALALCVSFLGAARLRDGVALDLFLSDGGLLRIALPTLAALLGIVLEDAYADSARHSPLTLMRGPLIGIGLALIAGGFALPQLILYYGCAMGLVLCTAIRMFFPPVANPLQGVNAPADWLKRTGAGNGDWHGAGRGVAGVVALLVVMWMVYHLSR